MFFFLIQDGSTSREHLVREKLPDEEVETSEKVEKDTRNRARCDHWI